MTPLRLTLAYALDLVAGDPQWLPHPVRIFGKLIQAGERWLRPRARTPGAELVAGATLTASVVSLAWMCGHPRAAGWQISLAWTTLATRNLLDESRSVIRAMEAADLVLARRRLARIVGRDTADLNETEIARAVIETLAESACDGIVAPLFWLAAGGVPAAMAYKAINTLDSMIGHREPRYLYFGRVAARVDDAANFFPARLTALAIAAAADVHRLNGTRSLAIWRRDGHRHASPNAGRSEAAMAGALGVRLGGTNFYDGRAHHGAILYSEGRPATIHDAKRAVKIVATVSALAFGAALLVLARKRR
ncbi:MAG TPA: adenosylcobinamide-phosphate synthase CbiB [Bryobacteraceae bacterium]|nr:adenosylcobinamide-phosphate synthase CbiB [Bryobacteraceae bacterium]